MNQWPSQLDRRLARSSDTITLRRYYGTGAIRTWKDVCLPAKVKGMVAEQLIGGITQQTFVVIFSPTLLIKDGWPNEASPPAARTIAAGSLAQVPVTTDKAVIRGGELAISRAVPVFEGDRCLRIELTATG